MIFEREIRMDIYSLLDNKYIPQLNTVDNFFIRQLYGLAVTNAKNYKMLGEYFGPNLEKWIKFFQQSNNLTSDGCIGPITLAKLREYGLDA